MTSLNLPGETMTKRLVLVCLAVFCFCGIASSQSSFVIPVTNTTGQAVAGATVTLTCLSGTCVGSGPYLALTDSSGNAQFLNIVAGTYTLAISGLGVTSRSYTYSVPGAAGAVSSVFGRTGGVVATSGDYSFSLISGTLGLGQIPTGGTNATFLRGDGVWAAGSAPVSSVFGRTGSVVATSGDYSFSLLSGSALATQLPGFGVTTVYGTSCTIGGASCTPSVPVGNLPGSGVTTVNGTSCTIGSSCTPPPPTQYKKLRCEPGFGDGLNTIAVGTYLQSTCYNDSGVTWTIAGIKCFTDNNGTSTLNVAGNSLGALLTGAVTCTSSFAAGTQSANVALTSGDYIKFTFVSDGASKQATFVVSMTQ